MPPKPVSKIFNIPFSGGAATVVTLIKYRYPGETEERHISGVTQYSTDGMTVDFSLMGDLSQEISASGGTMTVTLTAMTGYTLTDCRCCLIPGDPFA